MRRDEDHEPMKVLRTDIPKKMKKIRHQQDEIRMPTRHVKYSPEIGQGDGQSDME